MRKWHISFDRNALGQVAWLVDITTTPDSQVIRKSLQRNCCKNGSEQGWGFRNPQDKIRFLFDVLVAHSSNSDNDSVARFHLFDL
jgi:hypothetical protein